jgi:hypothetical protein
MLKDSWVIICSKDCEHCQDRKNELKAQYGDSVDIFYDCEAF